MRDDMMLRYQKQFQADPASYHKHSKDTGGYWIAKVCLLHCTAYINAGGCIYSPWKQQQQQTHASWKQSDLGTHLLASACHTCLRWCCTRVDAGEASCLTSHAGSLSHKCLLAIRQHGRHCAQMALATLQLLRSSPSAPSCVKHYQGGTAHNKPHVIKWVLDGFIGMGV